MKKILIYTAFLMAVIFVGCSDDAKLLISENPVAPVLSAPSQSTTAYVKDSAAYILSMDSTGLAETFKVSAADYGVSAPVTYSLQIDKTGKNFANFQTITSSSTPNLEVTVVQLYNALTGATALNLPTNVKASIDVRVMATIGASLQPVYSNVKTIIVKPLPSLKPYYAVTPKPYYIIGLGDGTWNNSPAGLGVSLYPMSVVSGFAYTSAGAGLFTFTGYFKASRTFKLIRDLGSWNEQWGNSGQDGIDSPVHNDGGSKNFKVPSDGYYTITLNSISNTLTIVAASAPAKSFGAIGMIGEFNGWGADVAMTASETTNNHYWYTTYTFSSDFTPPVGSGGMKFRADAAWTNNWGAGYFPVGIGTNGGTNVPHMAGTYKVLFNDVDGCYYFVKL